MGDDEPAQDDIFSAAARGDLASVKYYIERERVLDRSTLPRPADIPTQWRDMFVSGERSRARAAAAAVRTELSPPTAAPRQISRARRWRAGDVGLLKVRRMGGGPSYVSKHGERHSTEVVDWAEPRQQALLRMGAMSTASSTADVRRRAAAALSAKAKASGAMASDSASPPSIPVTHMSSQLLGLTAPEAATAVFDRAAEPMSPDDLLDRALAQPLRNLTIGGHSTLGEHSIEDPTHVAAHELRTSAAQPDPLAQVTRDLCGVGASEVEKAGVTALVRAEQTLDDAAKHHMSISAAVDLAARRAAAHRADGEALRPVRKARVISDPQHDDHEVFARYEAAAGALRAAEQSQKDAEAALQQAQQYEHEALEHVAERRERMAQAKVEAKDAEKALRDTRREALETKERAFHELDKHLKMAFRKRAELLDEQAVKEEAEAEAAKLLAIRCQRAINVSQAEEVQRRSMLAAAKQDMEVSVSRVQRQKARTAAAKGEADMYLARGMHIRAPACTRDGQASVAHMRHQLKELGGTAPTALKDLRGRRPHELRAARSRGTGAARARQHEARLGTRHAQALAAGELHRLGALRRIFRAWVGCAYAANARKVTRAQKTRYVLVCRTGEGRVVTCKVNCTTIGREVKHMLTKLLNLPLNTQMAIIYKGTEVGDEQTLTFHGITQDNDIVEVFIG